MVGKADGSRWLRPSTTTFAPSNPLAQIAVCGMIGLQDSYVNLGPEREWAEPQGAQLLLRVHRVMDSDNRPLCLECRHGREYAGERRLLHPAAIGGAEDDDTRTGQVAVRLPARPTT